MAVEEGRTLRNERNPSPLQGLEGPFVDKPALNLVSVPSRQSPLNFEIIIIIFIIIIIII